MNLQPRTISTYEIIPGAIFDSNNFGKFQILEKMTVIGEKIFTKIIMDLKEFIKLNS